MRFLFIINFINLFMFAPTFGAIYVTTVLECVIINSCFLLIISYIFPINTEQESKNTL